MGRYTEVTREIGRLEANLAAVQAALRAAEEEGDRARANAADAQARAIGAFLRFLLVLCWVITFGIAHFRFRGGGGHFTP